MINITTDTYVDNDVLKFTGGGMKLDEIIKQKELDEDWKHAVAAGVMALGGLSGGNSNKAEPPAQSQVHHINQSPHHAFKIPNLSGTAMEAALHKKAIAAGIRGVELAQFLAQCAHESHGFTKSREEGSPAYFAKKYDPNHAPRTAKLLGNTKVGDGEKYRGAGPLQVTGKYWFGQAQKDLGVPLLAEPGLSDNLNTGADLAIWYWKKKVRPNVSDFSNTPAVTRQINSRLDKVDRRIELFKTYTQGSK